MPRIVVSYQCSIPTGEIVCIVGDDHKFSPAEQLAEWIAADPANNTRDNWTRLFTIVDITDKTLEELQYLTEPLAG